MTRHSNFLLIVLTTRSLLSCESYTELDLPPHDSKPVVQCYPTFGKELKMSVRPSFSIQTYNNNLNDIIRTQIFLWANNQVVDTLQLQNGLYRSTYVPLTGDILQIRFTHNTLDFQSQTIVPQPVVIDSARFSHDTFFDNFGEPFSEFFLYFDDIATEENYYEALVYHNYYNEEEYAYKRKFPYQYYSRDMAILNAEMLQYEPRSLLFSDRTFSGQKVSVRFAFDAPYPQYKERYINTTLLLLRVTEEYYQYRQSLYKQLFLQTPTVWSGLNEPVPVESNIENGYGVFAAYSIDSLVMVIPEYQNK